MDYVIRGGSIVDGTGSAPYSADLGIRDGIIAEIAPKIDAQGAEIIDAKGCLVTPGFIDAHTHYDGQATWDDELNPSASHGVTTLIMGNCGVGFAPMRSTDRDELIRIMEGVEDIPGSVLADGIPEGKWETFPEFLNFLDSRRYAIDIGAYIPHSALRFYVMGERGARNEDATADDIERMAEITREAVAAGAIGFSTSRTVYHVPRGGDQPIPGTFASYDELLALVSGVAKAGRGVFEAVPAGIIGDFGGRFKEPAGPREETALYGDISRKTGIPATFTTYQMTSDPNCWRDVLEASAEANASGAKLYPQVGTRAQTALEGLSIYNQFQHRPSYVKIAHLPIPERVREMRKPEVRAAILGEEDGPMNPVMATLMAFFRKGLTEPTMFRMARPVDYEPAPEKSIAAMITRSGSDPEALLYDQLLEEDGQAIFMHLTTNYIEGHLGTTREMMLAPHSIVGLGDAGAHVNFVCDGGYTTFAISHWAYRRSRGERLPVEHVVAKLTGANAELFGMRDRGRLVPGLRADINVIDIDRLGVMPPYVRSDLPTGGQRLLQDGQGYVATFVAGVRTRANDVDTGERPGRLVRSTT